MAKHFLTFLRQPAIIQMDGSRFEFDSKLWPQNVLKICLAKSTPKWAEENGRSLFHVFATEDPVLYGLLMHVPVLECHLTEPDPHGHLFGWLHFPTNKKQQSRGRQMLLRGELANIEQFLRVARQHFAAAIEPHPYTVEIECHGEEGGRRLWHGWADKNWRTREQLSLQKVEEECTPSAGKKNGRSSYVLRRAENKMRLVEEAENMGAIGEDNNKNDNGPPVMIYFK